MEYRELISKWNYYFRIFKSEILNPKHETNPNSKFSNVQNKIESINELEVSVIWILKI